MTPHDPLNPTLTELLAAYGPYIATAVIGVAAFLLKREIRRLDTKLEMLETINTSVVKLQVDFENFEGRLLQIDDDRRRIWDKVSELTDIKVSVAKHDEAIDGLKHHPAIRGAAMNVEAVRATHIHYETPEKLPPVAPPKVSELIPDSADEN